MKKLNLTNNSTQPTKVAVIKGSYTDKHGNVTRYSYSIYSDDTVDYIKRLCNLERNAHPNVEQTIEWFDKDFLKKILCFVEVVAVVVKTDWAGHAINQKAYVDDKYSDMLWYTGPYGLDGLMYVDNYNEIDLIEFKKGV